MEDTNYGVNQVNDTSRLNDSDYLTLSPSKNELRMPPPNSPTYSIESKATSPLHIGVSTIGETSPIIPRKREATNIDKQDSNRLSKADFSYLSSQMSPMPGDWTIPENTNLNLSSQNFDKFIDSNTTLPSEDSSLSEYYTDDVSGSRNNLNSASIIHGILDDAEQLIPSDNSPNKISNDDEYENMDTFDSKALHVNETTLNASPTRSLNFTSGLSSDTNNLNFRLNDSVDYTADNSSYLNSSVPTQDLRNLKLHNRDTLSSDNNLSNYHDDIDRSENLPFDDDKTPIVGQNGFVNIDDLTPIVAASNRRSIDNEDLKLSSQAITEIFETNSASDRLTQPVFNRVQSTSSSVYSESIREHKPTNSFLNSNPRIQSTSSSMYSELPKTDNNGHDYKKQFRTSSLKLSLNKHLSVPLAGIQEQENENLNTDHLEIPPRRQASVTSNQLQQVEQYQQDEPLSFTNSSDHPHPNLRNDSRNLSLNENGEKYSGHKTNESLVETNKPRVSVLNKSMFENRYDSKTGLISNPNEIVSISNSQSFTRDHAPSSYRSSKASKDLSFRSSKQSNSLFSFDNEDEDDDASALFVTALYPFNSESLESENDSSICLSFDQDEIAFTYNLDDSGWGEVTLLSSLKRGWVPMNYFRSTVATNLSEMELKNLQPKKLTEMRAPLRLLLKHAGNFLLNPQSKPVYINNALKGYTFDVENFNGITDGLRKLLADTDCISRSSSIVQDKAVVRKMRKKLLRGWADLIAKAKDYMGTIATPKIEYLQLLTFHLLQKSITFLDIWGLEQDLITEENNSLEDELEYNASSKETQSKHTSLSSSKSNNVLNLDIRYLNEAPIVSYRVNEVYNQLLSYLCLVAGRIDLVEHNPNSFNIMGVVIGHINLLVNEYFFIIKLLRTSLDETEGSTKLTKSMSKYGKLSSDINLQNQLHALDTNIDKLRQLVDELNQYIKIVHGFSKKEIQRQNSSKSHGNITIGEQSSDLYFYSREGGSVVFCCCKMIELSSHAYRIIKSVVNFNNEVVLPNNRKYPNYLEMSISPQRFIRECTNAMISDTNIRKQVNQYKKMSMMPQSLEPAAKIDNRASRRYSIFKIGNSTDNQLSSSGLDFLSNIETNTASSSPFMSQNEFADPSQTDDLADFEFNVEDELIRNEKTNKIIGASFRALVHLLTDENNPPDYFYISSFFLTFRIFSDSAQLLDALIRRFDVNNSYKNKQHSFNNDSSIMESKIRSRRKLVVKTFQLWLESYWNSKADYVLLAPIMNFFNEGMKNYLPVESYQLLITASKLMGRPPIEHINDKLNYYNNMTNTRQLLPRKISPRLQKKTVSRMSLGATTFGLIGEIEAYNTFLDDVETYGLEKMDSNDMGDNSRSSLSLSLNIELKNSTSSSVLLTTQQKSTIKMVIMSYRRMLGTHWYKNYKKDEYCPLSTQVLIDAWWNASQENWKILNDDLTLLNFNGLEIAKQLTLIENKLFSAIQANELLNQNFTTKKLHLNLSPNIQKSILFTNLLSDYVIESILKPGLEMRQRIHAFKCWLKISISCLYLRNFNSLASIMTSLQSFLITRIVKIWDGLSDKYKELFQYLASIIHPNKNYSSYRERLKDFLYTNSQDKLDIPTVPYLSLFLQDLTFVVDGNPNYRTNTKSFLDEKVINIDKYFKITEIISDIQTLQISYKDIGELGNLYNDKNTDIVRSETIRNLKQQFNSENDVSYADMFDITGVPMLQELLLLEIWKVKQTNARDDDRSWKLSCAIQPREADA